MSDAGYVAPYALLPLEIVHWRFHWISTLENVAQKLLSRGFLEESGRESSLETSK